MLKKLLRKLGLAGQERGANKQEAFEKDGGVLFDLDLNPENIFKLPVGQVITVDGKDFRIIDKATHKYLDGYTEETLILEDVSGRLYYLSYEDDLKKFFLFRPEDQDKLGLKLAPYLQEHDELPDEIEFDGKTYKSVYNGSGAGYYYDSRVKEKPFVSWTYARTTEDGNREYLEIVQWGDEDFEVAVGRHIEGITIDLL